MISRRLRKVLAVIVGAVAAGVPVGLIHLGVDSYVEHQAAEEVRLTAQRAIARAEWRISQSIAALDEVGKPRLHSCAEVDAEAVRRAVMATTPIKQIAAVDGDLRCAASIGSAQEMMLSRELRTADDRVNLAVVRLTETGERALRVIWQRSVDPVQLVATIASDVFVSDGAAMKVESLPAARVMLSEGTVIAAPEESRESAAQEQGVIRAHNQSQRYPVVATASVSRAAVFAEHRELRVVAAIAGSTFALLIFAFALLMPWRERANPVAELERAVEAGEFIPYYQPVVDLRSGSVVGAEVLMRWRKADGTIIPPYNFIPLAESSGLILDMTRTLMISARDELATLLGHRRGLKVSFNLVAAHFRDDSFVDDVREIFGESPVRMSQIIFEVTERQPLQDLGQAREVIAGLQELGCKVAIDDVGTGHNGLSYMLKLGANYIKIDKMFVDAIGTERYSKTIIETLISLAQDMRLEIVAEGVETLAQAKYLRECGIFLAQGYAFAKPMPGPEFRQRVEAGQPFVVAAPETRAVAEGFAGARQLVPAA